MNDLRLYDLCGGSDAGLRPDALIIILFVAGEVAEHASFFTRQWHPTVPRSAFVGIEVDAVIGKTDIVALRGAIAKLATARSIQPSQIILCGTGDAGRLAVELLLQGLIPAAGVIGLDITLEPAAGRVLPTMAMVRLVQHRTTDDPSATRFHALIEALRRQDVDVRSMMLPDPAQASPRATVRAGGAFLAELVANASHIAAKTGSTF
jgi:predicted esterase